MSKKSAPPQLELRHLRYFLTLAKERHFGRAAERLKIAQPNLSQQIQKLEQIVGSRLLDRTRKAVRLTPAGELLAAGAVRTLDQAERAMQDARRAGRGELGKLRVTYVASAAYNGALTSMIAEYRRSYPNVELELSELEMRQQLDALAEGSADICYVRPPVALPEGIATVRILEEPTILALPATHPLARRTRVHVRNLTNEIFITPRHDPGVSFHHHTVAACRAAGFLPRMGPQGRDFMTIASMVAVGLGVAIVPRSVSCVTLPGVCYREFSGHAIMADLSIAFRKSDPSEAVRAFVKYSRSKWPRSASTPTK